MPVTTITESYAGSPALYVDCRNKAYPFVKDGYWFCHRYVGGTDYDNTASSVNIVLDGVVEITTIHAQEERAASTVAVVPTSITYSTDVGAVKTTIVFAVNAADSVYLYVNIIAKA
ncbi:MAG: hypothetical protein WC974_08920 [Thermoplasmata archaeon]